MVHRRLGVVEVHNDGRDTQLVALRLGRHRRHDGAHLVGTASCNEGHGRARCRIVVPELELDGVRPIVLPALAVEEELCLACKAHLWLDLAPARGGRAVRGELKVGVSLIAAVQVGSSQAELVALPRHQDVLADHQVCGVARCRELLGIGIEVKDTVLERPVEACAVLVQFAVQDRGLDGELLVRVHNATLWQGLDHDNRGNIAAGAWRGQRCHVNVDHRLVQLRRDGVPSHDRRQGVLTDHVEIVLGGVCRGENSVRHCDRRTVRCFLLWGCRGRANRRACGLICLACGILSGSLSILLQPPAPIAIAERSKSPEILNRFEEHTFQGDATHRDAKPVCNIRLKGVVEPGQVRGEGFELHIDCGTAGSVALLNSCVASLNIHFCGNWKACIHDRVETHVVERNVSHECEWHRLPYMQVPRNGNSPPVHERLLGHSEDKHVPPLRQLAWWEDEHRISDIRVEVALHVVKAVAVRERLWRLSIRSDVVAAPPEHEGPEGKLRVIGIRVVRVRRLGCVDDDIVCRCEH
mmetsp:Transcript_23514/g.80107  ORF Transcript_23514/g.80107 Transcript_23514/m.80107 type:complete len:525 (-) Transcript_23514:6684-8258(-)